MALLDNAANFCYGTVTTAPAPAASGTSMAVTLLGGPTLPAAPWNATVWPTGVGPLQSNAEIVRVTAIAMAGAVATLTITRAQESTSARTIVVGDQFALTITAKLVSDLNAAPPGSGTVTSVSVATANGFSGSVANATTTPAITIIAGAITPTSVAASGNVTGANLSGTNTGDQTNITGNAATVTTNANLTGHITSVGNATVLGSFTVAQLNTALSDGDVATGGGTASGTNTGDQTSVSGNAGTATALATARAIDGVNFDGTAPITVVAPATHAASDKATPVDADEIPLADSAASFVLKHLTWANLKATLKAYFDALYQPIAAALTSLASGTIGSSLTFAANTAIIYNAALSDQQYSGEATPGTAGAALAFGELCYLQASDSRWEKVDADAAATSGDVKVCMCVLAAAADGDPTLMMERGYIRADSLFPTFTISAQVYAGTNAGEVQVAQPSGTDDVIRVIGRGKTVDVLWFNPSEDYMVHT